MASSRDLTLPFTSLTSAGDNLDFSNDNGATWTYQPNVALGCDPAITHIHARFSETFGTSKSVQLRFRVQLK